jgi:hypothetical protein
LVHQDHKDRQELQVLLDSRESEASREILEHQGLQEIEEKWVQLVHRDNKGLRDSKESEDH